MRTTLTGKELLTDSKNKWEKTGMDMTSTLPLCHWHCNFVTITFKKKYWVEEEPGIFLTILQDWLTFV